MSSSNGLSVDEIQQAIDELRNYCTKICAMADMMISEAETCATNMEGDNVAQGASQSLKAAAASIKDVTTTEVDRLIGLLEQEITNVIPVGTWDD